MYRALRVDISIMDAMFADGFVENQEIPILCVCLRHTWSLLLKQAIIQYKKCLFANVKQFYVLTDGRGTFFSFGILL